MLQLSEITEFQDSVDDLTTLALSEVVKFWRNMDTDDGAGTAGAMREFIAELIDGYGPLTAELGASFYDTARESAEIPGPYLAEAVPVLSELIVPDLVGWSMAPLFRTKEILEADPVGGGVARTIAAPDVDLAFSRLTSGVQLEISGPARETVDMNSALDPARPTWARHASANACAFCALLATRGASYRSEAAAGVVTGRGVDPKAAKGGWRGSQAKGVRARGSRELGTKYHDHCHCVAVPVWPGEKYKPAPYVKEWEAAYIKAVKETPRKKTTTRKGKASSSIDVNGVLAHMREGLSVS